MPYWKPSSPESRTGSWHGQSIPIAYRPILQSSWTATAAGLGGAACREWPATQAGVGPVRSTVETCGRLGVKALTLYAFSVENWKRPRAEVETLWRLLRYYLRQELPELQKNDVRLQAIGRLEALPPQVRRELDAAVEATAANRGLLVNLAINYGGRAEIVDAVNAILEVARLEGSISTLKLDEELLSANLYTASCPDPDLLIRTSGEMRISNFLLWQIAYSELYVTETL